MWLTEMKEAESQHVKEKNNRHELRKNIPQFLSDLQSTLYGPDHLHTISLLFPLGAFCSVRSEILSSSAISPETLALCPPYENSLFARRQDWVLIRGGQGLKHIGHRSFEDVEASFCFCMRRGRSPTCQASVKGITGRQCGYHGSGRGIKLRTLRFSRHSIGLS